MKTRLTCGMLILFLLLTFVFSASCENPSDDPNAGDQDKDYGAIYNDMVAQFNLGEFKEAQKLYNDNKPDLVNDYPEAKNYVLYIEYWNKIKSETATTDDFDEAEVIFNALIKDGFSVAKIWCSYVAARKEESKAKHESPREAIESLKTAIDLYTTTGISFQDCSERIQYCKREQQRLEKEIVYQDAVKNLRTAIEEAKKVIERGNENQIDDTINLLYDLYKRFVSLGDYEEAINKAAECMEWIGRLERDIAVQAKNEGNRISVSWTDSEDGHSYSMRYRPDNSSDYIELDSCVSPVVLSDLIPDTSYVIQIVDGQNPQVKGEAVISTAPGEAFPANQILFSTQVIVGITRRETIRSSLAVHRIYEKQPNYRCIKEDNTFTDKETADYEMFCLLSYKNISGKNINAPVFCVLRSSTGAYRSASENKTLISDSYYYWLPLSIDDLINRMRDKRNILPADTYYLEVYLDGKLFWQGNFTII